MLQKKVFHVNEKKLMLHKKICHVNKKKDDAAKENILCFQKKFLIFSETALHRRALLYDWKKPYENQDFHIRFLRIIL